ncbi:unnamed protein product [Acanthocheilonema viteae]|uniref:Anti-proliferative protein domain-containing protein n=1 Tax=Acanthocheilonema viteae TaxID=6277 RepID=A0A498SRA7_ACAVI|nr:unnamed protein product [Acanthocheilonema viteae]
MYTEIKELVNFLAVYMHYRIPRRRITLYMESFGNHLITKFHDNWRPGEPKYAENERIVPIKSNESLDETFCAIAESNGVCTTDLNACFPSSVVAYCNPGEVTCRISDQPLVVIVWRGDVDIDRSYVPTPIGAAKYYDGKFSNIQNTVLNAYAANGPLARPNTSTNSKEVRPERCIQLVLVSSADTAYELLLAGLINDISDIPPILFCYKGPNAKRHRVQSFAITCFGTQRARRQFKDSTAYRAIKHKNALNAAASAAFFGNFPMHYFDLGAEGDNANVPAMSNQYTVTVPYMPPTFPNTVSTNNPMHSLADSSLVYARSNHSNSVFGIPNNSAMPIYPNYWLNSSDHSADNFPPASTNNSRGCSMRCTCDIEDIGAQSVQRGNNGGFPTCDQSRGNECNWCFTPFANDSAFKEEYDIWRPMPTFTMNNGNLVEPVYTNNYVVNTPIPSAPMANPDVNEAHATQSFQNSYDSNMNDLQHSMRNLSFKESKPSTSRLPQVFLARISPPRVYSPQQLFQPGASSSSVQPSQTFSQPPPQRMVQQYVPPSQPMSMQPILPQSTKMQRMPSQSMPIQTMSPQPMSTQQMSPQPMSTQQMSPQSIPMQQISPQSMPMQSSHSAVPVCQISPQPIPIQVIPSQTVPQLSVPMQQMPPRMLLPSMRPSYMMPLQMPLPYGMQPQTSRPPNHSPPNHSPPNHSPPNRSPPNRKTG